MIKKIGDIFYLLTEDGKKKIGEFTTKFQAEEREKEILKKKRKKALEGYKSDRDKGNIV